MQAPDLDELQRIWDLKGKGAISEEEYSRLKSRILGQNAETSEPVANDPLTNAPLAGTGVEFRNETYGSDVGKVLGIGGAAILVLVLIVAAIGAGGSNSSTGNSMNVDENLTTTDMNLTTVDMNATAAEPTSEKSEIAEDEVGRGGFTPSQANAARSAEQYLSMTGFSREGLIEQLSSDAGDGYSVADATAAVDSLSVDWNENAAKSARQYLNMSGFSCQELIEQLSSSAGDKYTRAQATYGAREAGAC